jgi:hypothetical protein
MRISIYSNYVILKKLSRVILIKPRFATENCIKNGERQRVIGPKYLYRVF